MISNWRRIKKLTCCMIFLLFVTLASFQADRGHAYVMPAEQLAELMAMNFSQINTLFITQSTTMKDQEEDTLVNEQIWLSVPDLFHTTTPDQGTKRAVVPDMAYRQLLMGGTKERYEQIFFWMGIDLQSVVFTRLDGIVAYRLGKEDAESPKIYIEKKRFLPLLVEYRVSSDPGDDLISVRFSDYKELENGWYPSLISYSSGTTLLETYLIKNIQTNILVNTSLMSSSGIEFSPLEEIYGRDTENPLTEGTEQEVAASPEAQAMNSDGTEASEQEKIEDIRLRDIINSFQEKYQ